MSNTKKGWHGDTPGHREAALKGQTNNIMRIPMDIQKQDPNDKDFGRDYRIEVNGLVVVPGIPAKIYYRTTQAKWDEQISPTVPHNFQPRYWKSKLVTEESQEYQNNIDEFKWWKQVKDKISGILKRHSTELPIDSIPSIKIPVKPDGIDVSEELTGKYDRITGIGIDMSRGLYATYLVTENFRKSDRFKRTIKRHDISEMGSSFAEKILKKYPNREQIIEFYENISRLVDTYQVFILGKEGLQEYYETTDDRALVDAISHGAYMDDEGYIVDPVTGKKI